MEPSPEYDSPWKEILEQYFEDFMAFFFPETHLDIDWSSEYTFLDKELEKIVRDAELGSRRVDKLARVRRINGEEAYVMAHIEIQGTYESGFAKRMYVYNYRLFDRYDTKIASMAVLADDRKKWKPQKYSYELWDSKAGLEFPVIKLLDYQDDFDKLAQDNNPFAIVVMAHLKTIETRKEPERRFRWKLNLIKMLYRRGYSKLNVLNLFRFIDWVMVLPKEMEKNLTVKMDEFQEEKKMRYVTNIEKFGIEKGLQQEAYKLIALQLKARFGAIPKWAEEKLSDAATEELENWGVQLISAKKIEDVFA
ncbi:DUF4351 domain-containing protein [Desulfococcaceae bacterium HSG9]|nr:DUF4351 domain-containing protein [Desulfococcaceae bacterium HSG9]